MPQPGHGRSVTIGRREKTSALNPSSRHRDSIRPATGRKRYRHESHDDVTSTHSVESTDLEDALESDCGSVSPDETASLLQPHLPKDLQHLACQLAGQTFPVVSQWMNSARYIPPPTIRIPPPKRSKTSSPTPRSILMETSDPSDPSTVLIFRIDGYYPLPCPFAISNPSHHGFCNLQHRLRSISDVVQHLIKHHPNPFYCPICSQTFANEPTCDSHIRERTCKPRSLDISKGVSQSTLREIIRRDKPHLPEEDRWRNIYRILLPGNKPPGRGTAYISQGLPLAVAMTRDYWEQHGRRIVGEYLAKVGSDGSVPTTGDEEVSMLCEIVERELVELVIAEHARKNCQISEVGEGVGEDKWVTVKAEQD
ncbi:uncharacterized protein PODANS_6_6490 [Podospora anserina S mat+]|uniref:Podospora anserina S mat+ genomic DNA chromosome 6, supercontig 2 n=1 Tax=Podospora anserina (strain S / ATCC MYA-4624 / DSM 980 / FGSC 10383) TaxID=515849 RepID=B2B3K5_PODAN|nr:uncharacterized protein PODANS_6_6490 [Podospora anserina S mat+]CAP71691.1 unnamed protein product [Podospora anserina S mat+]CDP31082.1 Putative protein of unknown function [Podospora anserina S mat+]